MTGPMTMPCLVEVGLVGQYGVELSQRWGSVPDLMIALQFSSCIAAFLGCIRRLRMGACRISRLGSV